MPKSRVRKKNKDNRPRPILEDENPLEVESPSWLAPVMVGTGITGLLWIVVFYLSQTLYPIPNIGAWNMVIGFLFIGVAFSLATRWR
ncbi:MAG: cell division protein CrgA [Actinobacteria bacterium]|jgi:Cell division protein CrgA|nr:cell division protein CrgA [Actinomycetota bacterium]